MDSSHTMLDTSLGCSAQLLMRKLPSESGLSFLDYYLEASQGKGFPCLKLSQVTIFHGVG